MSRTIMKPQFVRTKCNGKKILKNASKTRGLDNSLAKDAVQTTIKAIRSTRGLLTHAADKLGISLSAVQQRISTYPSVADAYNEQMERNLDDIEKNLMDSADERYPWAIKFFLQSRGKKRGYSDSVEHTGHVSISTSIITKDDVARLSVEEIRNLVEIIQRAKTPAALPAQKIVDVKHSVEGCS